MSDDRGGRNGTTRRDYLKYGGAVAAGGLFAGCAGDTETESSTTTTGTRTTDSPTDEGESYSASMAPVGEVTLKSPPERWIAYDGG